jgi:alpha-L-fucosidase 2
MSPNGFMFDGDPKHMGSNEINPDDSATMEGGSAAAAVMEMLLQSWGGVIRLFPAMPHHWRDAAFLSLRAEGAFLVSAQMRDGRVEWVRIVSEAGGTCRVRNPWGGEDFIFETEPDGVYRFPEGDEQHVAASFRRRPDQQNFFGVKEKPWQL